MINIHGLKALILLTLSSSMSLWLWLMIEDRLLTPSNTVFLIFLILMKPINSLTRNMSWLIQKKTWINHGYWIHNVSQCCGVGFSSTLLSHFYILIEHLSTFQGMKSFYSYHFDLSLTSYMLLFPQCTGAIHIIEVIFCLTISSKTIFPSWFHIENKFPILISATWFCFILRPGWRNEWVLKLVNRRNNMGKLECRPPEYP